MKSMEKIRFIQSPPPIKLKGKSKNFRLSSSVRRMVTQTYCFLLAFLFVLFLLVNAACMRNYLFPNIFRGAWQSVSTVRFIKMREASLSIMSLNDYGIVECNEYLVPTLDNIDSNKPVIRYTHALSHQVLKEVARNKHARFLPALRVSDKDRCLQESKLITSQLVIQNITHFLVASSAVGAYQFQGMLPWTKRVQLGVPVKRMRDVIQILGCIKHFTFWQKARTHWIFSSSEAPNCSVDVFFYFDDGDYVWSNKYFWTDDFIYRRQDVFPLEIVAFENLLVPVPRHLGDLLEYEGGTDTCFADKKPIFVKNQFNLSIEAYDVFSTKCKNLRYMYPELRKY